MSSNDGEESNPDVPKDSDRGSSVSSELQDEYEELLRYAVVTPRFELDAMQRYQHTSHLLADGRHSALVDSARSHPSMGSGPEQEGRRFSTGELTSARATPREHLAGAEVPAEATSVRTAAVSAVTSEGAQTPRGSPRHSAPNPMNPLFISEEKMGRMEHVLDTWSSSLKSNVLAELRKWQLAFVEQHRLEVKRERQRHAAHVVGLTTQMDSLRELLHTYETSNHRKDEVISNLTHGVERQRERLELMRNFTHWRLQHLEAREEAHGLKVAHRHYQQQLKRKVWLAWHSLISAKWRERVERACRAQAEAVCMQLSADHEAKVAEHTEALEKAHAEIQRLHGERERLEESMKKAFMRGVCALNMEAMSMFQGGEARPDHDLHPSADEPCSSSSVRFQNVPSSSLRFSPLHFESTSPTTPVQNDAEPMFTSQPGSVAGPYRTMEGGISSTTTTAHTVLPPGGTAATHRLGGTCVVTSVQQKAAKTITARITGRTELVSKAGRMCGNLQVMGVTPPMTSVVVERHHPVTQLTIGQATAAKFPRSAQLSSAPSVSKGSSQNPRAALFSSSSQIHSIKLVE